MILNLVPEHEGQIVNREQLIGESRGLLKLDLIIKARRNDLERKLNLTTEKNVAEHEPIGDQTLSQ